MKSIYLAAALIGALVPYVFFGQHFAANGLAIADFISAVFANPAASGFAADLLISSFVFWMLMFTAGKGSPNPWPFVALNLLIGLSCALPAYLFWRSRGEPANA